MQVAALIEAQMFSTETQLSWSDFLQLWGNDTICVVLKQKIWLILTGLPLHQSLDQSYYHCNERQYGPQLRNQIIGFGPCFSLFQQLCEPLWMQQRFELFSDWNSVFLLCSLLWLKAYATDPVSSLSLLLTRRHFTDGARNLSTIFPIFVRYNLQDVYKFWIHISFKFISDICLHSLNWAFDWEVTGISFASFLFIEPIAKLKDCRPSMKSGLVLVYIGDGWWRSSALLRRERFFGFMANSRLGPGQILHFKMNRTLWCWKARN